MSLSHLTTTLASFLIHLICPHKFSHTYSLVSEGCLAEIPTRTVKAARLLSRQRSMTIILAMPRRAVFPRFLSLFQHTVTVPEDLLQ